MESNKRGERLIVFDVRSFLNLFQKGEKDWAIGGAELQMFYLAKELLNSGYRVVLLGNSSGEDLEDPRFEYCRIPKYYQGSKFHPQKIANLWRSRWPRMLRNLQKQGLKLVYIQSQLECPRMTRSAKRNGVKIIRRINGDSLVDSNIDESSARVKHDRLIRAADCIVVQSEKQRSDLAKNYGLSSTIISSLEPELEYGLENWLAQAIWIGRSDPKKNPEAFLDLADQMPERKFVMIMPRSASPLFSQISSRATMLDNLIFLPDLKRSKLLEIVSQSAVAVNTSYTEGMPNTLFEASLFAVPTVFLYVNPGNQIKEDMGVFICEGDFNCLKERVELMLESRILSKQEGAKARRWMKGYFNNSEVVSQYGKLIDN